MTKISFMEISIGRQLLRVELVFHYSPAPVITKHMIYTPKRFVQCTCRVDSPVMYETKDTTLECQVLVKCVFDFINKTSCYFSCVILKPDF